MRRIYTHEDKASARIALDLNGGNALRTAKQLDIPVATLRSWSRRGVFHDTDIETAYGQQVQSLTEKLEAIAHQALDTLPEKLDKASPQQLMTICAIAIDKMNALKDRDQGKDDEPDEAEVIESILEKMNRFTERHRSHNPTPTE